MPAERPRSSEGAQKDPMQRAVDRVEELASSPDYNKSTLQRALNRVRSTGLKIGTSPGELYANLANLSGKIAESAGEHGQEADQQEFLSKKQEFEHASEQLGKPKKGKKNKKSSGSSKPGRKSGVAAG